MGEARRKQYSKGDFLAEHARCVYCGMRSTTTDHCPPRCFFVGRVWPETFEYPACSSCNSAARLDEQALACLVRARTGMDVNSVAFSEWTKLVDGVRNNNKAIVQEWTGKTANQQKRSFRDSFGRDDGDALRRAGWGMVTVEPLTTEVIRRFSVRLGQTLFYKYIGRIFQGTVYSQHFNLVLQPNPEGLVKALLSIAPEFADVSRSGKSLDQQFAYRYNFSPEHGIIYANLHFSDQFVFYVLAAEPEMAKRIELGNIMPDDFGHKTLVKL